MWVAWAICNCLVTLAAHGQHANKLKNRRSFGGPAKRLQCQLLIHCFATEDTVRGGLIIAEDATRVFAFVLAWAMALGFVKPRENQGEDDLESESLPSPTKTKLSQETSSRCFLF